jgi:Nucleotidyltransferase domain
VRGDVAVSNSEHARSVVDCGAGARAIVDAMQAEFGEELVGVALTGSRVRGDGRDESDLDVLVVVRSAVWQRRYQPPAHDGADVDLTIGGLEFFARSLHAGANVGLTTMFADAVVAYDDGSGRIAGLARIARELVATGRPPLTPEALFVLRHRAWSLAQSARDAVRSDAAAAAFVLDGLVTFLVDAYCSINGLWLSGPKAVCRTLPRIAPELWSRVTSVELERDPERRIASMEALLDFVLAPVGGPLRYGSSAPLALDLV